VRRGSAVALAVLLAAVLAACVGGSSAPTSGSSPTGMDPACGSSAPAVDAPAPVASLACATPVTTGPPGGLSKEDAVKIALQLAPPSSSAPTVAWTYPNPYYGLQTSVPRGAWFWMIGLAGDFEDVVCPTTPASPRPCGPATNWLEIDIDYYTGAFIDSSFY
jgi:hypothetical protein